MTVYAETRSAHGVWPDLLAKAKLAYLDTCGPCVVEKCLLMIEASATHRKEVDDLPPPGTLDVSRSVWKANGLAHFPRFFTSASIIDGAVYTAASTLR